MPKRLPWVIPEYCEGCTACIGACPKMLLLMRDVTEDAQIPWLDDPSECTGCGRCEDACPLGGISMTAHVQEAAERFATRLRADRQAISEDDECRQ